MQRTAVVPDSRDVRYVLDNFHSFANLSRIWGLSEGRVRHDIKRGLLPRATYTLGDGIEYFPRDYFIFPSMAKPSNRKSAFIRRLNEAHARNSLGLAYDESERLWNEYLSGSFGACLYVVLPETITRKITLTGAIERLVAKAEPENAIWRSRLANHVDLLDALLRPATNLDRAVAEGPVARDRFVTEVRAQYLSLEPNLKSRTIEGGRH